jgi:hypothetical protein
MSGKREYINPLEDIEMELADSLREAKAAGLSVLEIAAIIGRRKALIIYRLFQKNGLIGNSVKKSRFRGPHFLGEALEQTSLSFTRWCNCWGFDPCLAQTALNSDPSLPSAKRYHEAARRDFPYAYRDEKPGNIDLDEWEQEITTRQAGLSYHLDWDGVREEYVGTVSEIPSLRIVGKYPSDLLMILIRGAWLKKSIEKIEVEVSFRKNILLNDFK